MKNILAILVSFVFNSNPILAQNDSIRCELMVYNLSYKECILKDKLIMQALDEMLVNLEEEPEEGVYFPYSKSLSFVKEEPDIKIIMSSSPNYEDTLDALTKLNFQNGFMYAFQYKGVYISMIFDLQKDSWSKEVFYKYFKLTGDKINVPIYSFNKGDLHCFFSKKYKQTFIFNIDSSKIYKKEIIKTWFWPWD